MKSSLKRAEKMFLGRMSANEMRTFFEDCRENRPLRNRWKRLRDIETSLCGSENPEIFTHFDAERMEKIVLQRAGIQPKSSLSWTEIFEMLRGDFLKAATALGVLMVGLVVWLSVPGPIDIPEEYPVIPPSEFRAKGGETFGDAALYVFCWNREENELRRIIDISYADTEKESECNLTDSLQFAYANHSSQYNYVYVLGWNENGERTWYYPRPSDDASKEIKTQVEPRAWEKSIFLEVNHREGRHTIAALFSKQALTTKEVSKAFDSISRRHHDPMEWPSLKIEGTNIIEQRIRFNIRDKDEREER